MHTADLQQLLIAQKNAWDREEESTRGTVCFSPARRYQVGVFLFISREKKQQILISMHTIIQSLTGFCGTAIWKTQPGTELLYGRKLSISGKTAPTKFSPSSKGVLHQHTGISFPPSITAVTDALEDDSTHLHHSRQLGTTKVTRCMQREIQIQLGKVWVAKPTPALSKGSASLPSNSSPTSFSPTPRWGHLSF